MRLKSPSQAPQLRMIDINGQPVVLGKGPRRTLVCFFRDATCPFCNFHIYLLTHRYADLARRGLDVVALFCSTPETVRRFVAQHPRPFPVIADPESRAYEAYHIERSFWRKLRAVITRFPTMLKGLRMVGLAGLRTNNIVPADFLIDEDGKIVDAYYGKDAGDHMSFDRIEAFAERGAWLHRAQAA